MRPIAILYENETWMAPLFGALDRLGAPYEPVFVNDLSFDPAGPAPEWSLAVNKVSPSSYLRGHARSIESEDGAIRRVEFLDGEYLYAIRIATEPGKDFNLCPADICQVQESADLDNCVVEAPAKKQLRIDAADAPAAVVDDVLRIGRAGGLDIGGVEYLVAARDGLQYVYDINALSNFVTHAATLVGFDPHARFAEWLVARARSGERETAVA